MRQRAEIDPAVAAVLGDATRRQRRRSMTRTQRRQAERDAQRQRVTYEIDPRIAVMIGRVAEAEGCSPAGVVNRLMSDALARYAGGEVEFYGHRRASQCPRYEWVVESGSLRLPALEETLDAFLESDGDRIPDA